MLDRGLGTVLMYLDGCRRAMPEPLVTILVPVLDVAGLLPQCLDSVLAQTHRPLEIIVVNDGSTDDSAAPPGRTSW